MERFWSKTEEMPDGCIEWRGYVQRDGYGQFRVNGKVVMAHRWAYEEAHGPITPGWHIDHLCMNRVCVNVDHLQVVTHLVNQQRKQAAAWKREPTCRKCGSNVWLVQQRKTGVVRLCRECNRRSCRAYYKQKKGRSL